jgi:hypothetical protein
MAKTQGESFGHLGRFLTKTGDKRDPNLETIAIIHRLQTTRLYKLKVKTIKEFSRKGAKADDEMKVRE